MMDTRQHTKIGEELKREKKFSQNIIATIPDSLLVLDKDLRVKSANRSFYRLFQTKPKEIVGSKIGDILGDADGKLGAKLAKLFGTEDVLENFELHYRSEKLGERIFNITARGMIVAEEEEEEEVVVIQDITERKQAEEALRQSEERYRTILESVEDGYFEVDIAGNFTFFNESLRRIFGYSAEELMGMNSRTYSVGEDSRRVYEAFNEVYRTGKPMQAFCWGIVRKDGSTRFLETSASLIRGREGNPIGFRGVSRDITERKQAEENLRASEKRYRTLVENANEVIIVVQDGMLKFANPRTAELTGYSKEELISMPFTKLIHPDEQKIVVERHLRRLKGEKFTNVYPFKVIRKNGNIMWAEANATLIAWGGKPATLNFLNDITERKQAEEALQKYRVMIQSAQDAIFFKDLDSRYIVANPKTLEAFGLPHEQVIGKNDYELMPDKEEAKKNIEDDQAVFKTGESTEITKHMTSVDGRECWFSAVKVPYFDTGGRVIGLVGIARDITERKRMEESLRLSEQNLRDSIENSPLGIRIANEDGKTLYVNRALLDIYGYSSVEELEAVPRKQRYTPEGYAEHQIRKEKRLLGEYVPPEYEISIVHKNGEIRHLQVFRKEVLWNGQAQYQSIYQDITERRKAEEELQQSEERYRTILEEIQDSYFEVDLAGNLTFINDSTCRNLGYSREELLGMNYRGFTAEEDIEHIYQAFNEVYRTGEPNKGFTWKIIRKDGSIGFADASVSPLRSQGGEIVGFRGVGRDITERKYVEEEQQRAEKLESIGVFAGGIAHDFNNILTAILGNINLARMDAKPDSELHECLEEAEKASLRAKDLTQQMLTFTKGEALDKELVSLSPVLKDTAGLSLRGSNVICNFSIYRDLWRVEINEDQISQVISNIIINARQAMPDGGTIEIEAKNITLNARQNLGKSLPLKGGNYIRIAITDHGTGMPQELLQKIFDPYFTTKQKGSGLGLATSTSIAHNHGGHISVKSELGAGSTFYVYLPAVKKNALPKKVEKKESTPVGKNKILVMDDEDTVRKVAGRMLKRIGCDDIEFAADGAEAIRLYSEAMKEDKPFDVAILDLTIPGGMGGKEAIKELLKIDPEVKAIVSSGYSSELAIAEYKLYGFSGVVSKPYILDQLRQALHDVLG